MLKNIDRGRNSAKNDKFDNLNKQYALRALFAPSGFEKPQSASPLCGFLSPTFQPTKNLRFFL